MAKRLLTLRQIQAEKYPRGRSTVYAEIAAGIFPKPIGGCVPNMWEEDAVDRFVEAFIAAAKDRQADGQHRIAKASATLTRRRAERTTPSMLKRETANPAPGSGNSGAAGQRGASVIDRIVGGGR